jgi:hypothetical protein
VIKGERDLLRVEVRPGKWVAVVRMSGKEVSIPRADLWEACRHEDEGSALFYRWLRDQSLNDV